MEMKMTKQEAQVLWLAAMQSKDFEPMIRLHTAGKPLAAMRQSDRDKAVAAILRDMAQAIDPQPEF